MSITTDTRRQESQTLEEPVRPEGILANAAREALRYKLSNYLVVDCDALKAADVEMFELGMWRGLGKI